MLVILASRDAMSAEEPPRDAAEEIELEEGAELT